MKTSAKKIKSKIWPSNKKAKKKKKEEKNMSFEVRWKKENCKKQKDATEKVAHSANDFSVAFLQFKIVEQIALKTGQNVVRFIKY